MSSKIGILVGIVLLAGASTGCNDLTSQFNRRWGPDPVIQAADFSNVASNQSLVLNYLGRSAGYVAPDGTSTRQMSPADWAEIAQWGFNVGRQDCEIYMDTLFRLNREKGRNDTMLAALGSAAAAIVTGTTTAQKPLSILAAVFGLSVALNDSLFQSYLYTQAPGLVAKKVSDMQDVFRNSVVTGQVKVASASSAFYAIQSYYHICLPHSIEGVMLQTIADSNPVTPPATGVAAGGPPGATPSAPATAMRVPELK